MGERNAMTPGPAAAPTAGEPAGAARTGRPGLRVALVGVLAVTATAVALMLLGSVSGGASPRRLAAAKGFSLPALGSAGRRVSLSAYAGRPVIVNFFASWCTPCQQETPMIARYYRSSHGRVAIIGVDVNDPAAAAITFTHANGVAYPVGVDGATAPTASAYGVIALPQTFFLDSRHLIVKRVVGQLRLSQLEAGAAMIESRTK